MSKFVQIYPSDAFFNVEHGDEHVTWVEANPSQIKIFEDTPWIVCTEIEAEFLHFDGTGVDFRIADKDDSAAYIILHNKLMKLTEEESA